VQVLSERCFDQVVYANIEHSFGPKAVNFNQRRSHGRWRPRRIRASYDRGAVYRKSAVPIPERQYPFQPNSWASTFVPSARMRISRSDRCSTHLMNVDGNGKKTSRRSAMARRVLRGQSRRFRLLPANIASRHLEMAMIRIYLQSMAKKGKKHSSSNRQG